MEDKIKGKEILKEVVQFLMRKLGIYSLKVIFTQVFERYEEEYYVSLDQGHSRKNDKHQQGHEGRNEWDVV